MPNDDARADLAVQFARLTDELAEVLKKYEDVQQHFRVVVTPRRRASMRMLPTLEALDADPCAKCKKGQRCELEPISGEWRCKW
jgi:hypothetical protein